MQQSSCFTHEHVAAGRRRRPASAARARTAVVPRACDNTCCACCVCGCACDTTALVKCFQHTYHRATAQRSLCLRTARLGKDAGRDASAEFICAKPGRARFEQQAVRTGTAQIGGRAHPRILASSEGAPVRDWQLLGSVSVRVAALLVADIIGSVADGRASRTHIP